MNDTEKLEMINDKLVEGLQTFQTEYVTNKYVNSKYRMINYALVLYVESILKDISTYSKKETATEIIEHLKHIFETDEKRFANHNGNMLYVSQYANKMLEFITEMEK